MVLRALNRLIKQPPYLLTFAIAQNAIQLKITQAEKAVPRTTISGMTVLPPVVRTYLGQQPELEVGQYVIPFPAARRIIRELRDHPSEQIQLECSVLDALKPVAIPPNFTIEWRFDHSRMSLVRSLTNADGYIGGGCFVCGSVVWRIENLNDTVERWVSLPDIPSAETMLFLQYGFPALPAPHRRCDTELTHGGQALVIAGKTFAIVDGASLPLRWHMRHRMRKGIGYYEAIPLLAFSQGDIPLASIMRNLESDAHFYSVGNSWIEYTQDFRRQASDWLAKGVKALPLFPQEIMGVNLSRLSKMGLQPPKIDVQLQGTEHDKARHFLELLRNHGLPAGITGFQENIIPILVSECASLLHDDDRAKILWIVPKRRKGTVIEALRQARLQPVGPTAVQAGQIAVTSLDQPFSLKLSWSLVIFTDMDLLPMQDNHVRIYAALPRTWTISTYDRPDWHRDRNRATKLLRSIKLDPNDLPAYLNICTRTFSQQSTGLLARLTSPFKQIVIGSDSPSEASVPIPRLMTLTKPSSPVVRTADNVFRPNFTVADQHAVRGSFLEQARAYVNRTEPAAEPVPFMRYFPTYEVLIPEQSQWYFYWRTQVREGKYLPADLSYLFLHVYEVLHTVGFPNAQAAFDYLAQFWQHYRTLYPRLDGYLINWLADFTVYYGLSIKPLEWYRRVATTGGSLPNANIAIETWLIANDDLSLIPDSVLDMLCQYKRTKSKFYQQYNVDGSIEAAIRQGLASIDRHVRARHSKSLLELHRPQGRETIRRVPFASAVFQGKRDEITIGTFPAWAEAEALQTAVTAIIRYTEHRLRQQRSYRGKSQILELPDDWIAVLNDLFPVVTAPKSSKTRTSTPASPAQDSSVSPVVEDIVFDFAEIEELHRVSAAVRERLTVEDDEPEQSNSEEQTALAAGLPALSPVETNVGVTSDLPSGAQASTPHSFITERPANTPAHLLTDLREVAAILAGDEAVIRLLQVMQARNWTCAENILQSAVEHEFISVVLDRLNERANEMIGDLLVFPEGDILTVSEDYRDEIEFLFAHPVTEPETVLLISAPPIELDEATVYADLTPEWAGFAANMCPEHWEALSILLIGEAVTPRLDELARHHYTTPNLLIEAINDFALEAIGDIVVDTTGTPFVEEEDLEPLRALLTWAQEHVIKE